MAMGVIKPLIDKYWLQIKEGLLAIRDAFFSKDSFFGKLIDCRKKISTNLFNSVKDFFSKLQEKWKMYKGISGLGLPYVILYGADMLFESMCDKVVSKSLLEESKAIIDANSAKDKNTEHVTGGK